MCWAAPNGPLAAADRRNNLARSLDGSKAQCTACWHPAPARLQLPSPWLAERPGRDVYRRLGGSGSGSGARSPGRCPPAPCSSGQRGRQLSRALLRRVNLHAARDARRAGIRGVEGYDASFMLDTASEEVLTALLRSDTFRQQVGRPAAQPTAAAHCSLAHAAAAMNARRLAGKYASAALATAARRGISSCPPRPAAAGGAAVWPAGGKPAGVYGHSVPARALEPHHQARHAGGARKGGELGWLGRAGRRAAGRRRAGRQHAQVGLQVCKGSQAQRAAAQGLQDSSR